MTSYLGDRLYGADVGVWPEQNVLQLRLLLIDPLHRQPLRILLSLLQRLVFKEVLVRMTQGWILDLYFIL